MASRVPRGSTLNSQSSEAQTTRLEGDPYQDATELERINANGGGVAADVLQRGGSATVGQGKCKS
jgi:CRISPR/Cas system CMR subunit Cmr4 (Cas7 group RAMP superfamily)